MITYHVKATKLSSTYNPQDGTTTETLSELVLVLVTCCRCDCLIQYTDTRTLGGIHGNPERRCCSRCGEIAEQEEPDLTHH